MLLKVRFAYFWLISFVGDEKLHAILEDCHSFCCSFCVPKLVDEFKAEAEENTDIEMSAFEPTLTEEQKHAVATKEAKV